ncbi:hypothetical protein FNL39_108120 [Nocardia caishijiensis]|uniref:Uncharacterized protein n=1 Tax=Nocardia caishijiensis TaxID=184756 RepID=A0ABQ6YHP9_9NOCA|nr:hypothetical protein FNL39_108120 [Nocardia caishijiensis]
MLLGLAALGTVLLIDNWHPVRAAAYVAGWLVVAAILIRFARR